MDPFMQILFKMLFMLSILQKKFENFSCHLKVISRSFQSRIKITNVTVLVSHSVIAWKLHECCSFFQVSFNLDTMIHANSTEMFAVHCFVDIQGHFKLLHIDLLIIKTQKAIKRYIQNPHFGN